MENIPLDNNTIATMLGHAQKIVGESVELDFSHKSIKAIEEVVNLMHSEYVHEEEHNNDSLSGICLSLGIYLGESIRHKMSDSRLRWWYGVPKTSGDATAFLSFEDNEIYTVDWVMKQIIYGTRESIYKKYQLHLQLLIDLRDK